MNANATSVMWTRSEDQKFVGMNQTSPKAATVEINAWTFTIQRKALWSQWIMTVRVSPLMKVLMKMRREEEDPPDRHPRT